MAAVDTSSAKVSLPAIAHALIAAGRLDPKSAEALYRKSQASKTGFLAELTSSGLVGAADLAQTVSAAYCVPLLDLAAVDPQRLPKGLLDPKLCNAYRVVTLAKKANRLIVATADPSDQEAAEKIKFATQLGIEWVIAEYDKLMKLVESANTSAAESIDNIVGNDFDFDESSLEEADADTAEEAISEVDDAPVVKFLHKMLVDAFNMRASDLHFEPYEFTYRVRFRIDGELREIATPPIAIKEKLASRIKVISRLDISEKRIPQDGDRKSVV